MNALLQIAVLGYLLFCIVNVWRRPGAFAGLLLCSYGLGALLGSLGGGLALIGVLASAGAYVLKVTKAGTLLPAEVGFILWLVETTLLAFWSQQMELTGAFLLSMYSLGVATYLFARTFANTPNFMRHVYWSTIVATTMTYASLVGSAVRVARLGAATGGPQGSARNDIGLSALGEVGLILSMALVMFDRQSKLYVKLIVVLLAAGVLIPFTVSTGTRGVLASCGAVFAMYVAIYLLRTKLRTALSGMLMGAIVVPASALLFLAVAPVRLRATLAGGVLRLISTSDLSDSTSVRERLDGYNQALDMIKDAPLFGYGPGAFGYMNDGVGTAGNYPHNLELELLVTGGILGLVLFAWFVVPLLWHALLEAMKKPISWENTAILGLLVSGLIRVQVSFSVVSAKSLYFTLGCAAAIWAARRIPALGAAAPEPSLPDGSAEPRPSG